MPVQAGEGQLDKPNLIMCDQIKCTSCHRLKKPLGYISNQVMSDIENMVKRLLDIDLP
ncbi:MAG: type II toxin-antitoxin system PemK/MazF family toxin [Actinobacteria bacterium]|nr:type II toxin-antitoxin system PemK/MazF family toxin [Actinomycetota bacterium]MBU4302545.1 type II toxin-antitoxin system PemK/MazF family toxin [Actinomycetota bacterium]MBU4490621.1 type II toxin-antitoxin system PemK/MazF family toxin [Actinomycetota bacterium]